MPRLRNPGPGKWRTGRLPTPQSQGSLEKNSETQEVWAGHPFPFSPWTYLFLLLPLRPKCWPLYGTFVPGSLCWQYGSPLPYLHVHSYLTYWIASSSITISSAFSHSHHLMGRQGEIIWLVEVDSGDGNSLHKNKQTNKQKTRKTALCCHLSLNSYFVCNLIKFLWVSSFSHILYSSHKNKPAYRMCTRYPPQESLNFRIFRIMKY